MSDETTTTEDTSAGEIFDPEIHATDRKGNPSLNKDGSFRKKRVDAGAGKTRSRPRPSAGTSHAGCPPPRRPPCSWRSVAEFLSLPTAGVAMVDPVMGYAATEVAPMWAEALADLAVERPQFAAVLERLGGVGAVGGVITVGVLTFVQFGHLAGKVPPHIAKTLGCKSREEIETILKQRGEQLARASRPAPAEHAYAPEAGVMAGV